MELWSILQKNQVLHKAHTGKRCFIIANGPSLNKQDLRILRDEITIVVNSFYMHPDLQEIRPQYWVLADPLYWESPEKILIPTIDAILSQNLNIRLVMPSGAIPTMARLNYGPLIEPYFFHYDSYHQDSIRSIDFTRPIPPFGQTVVIPALMLAYYLGCNPIYLLGCDHDWFGWTAETYDQAEFPHFYQKDGNPEAEVSHQDMFSFEEISRVVGIMKHQYGLLREYGEATGLRVYNATEGGHLEIFPRADYSSLVSSEPAALPQEALIGSMLADAYRLAESAMRLLRADDALGALALVEKAIEANTHRFTRVTGLDSLKTMCLARLGVPGHSPDFRDGVSLYPQDGPSIFGVERGGGDIPVETLKSWAHDQSAAGERCFNDDNLAGALREFRMAQDLDPEGAFVYNNLGVLYWQAGLQEQALSYFKRALTLEPGNADSLINCVDACRALGRTEDLKALIRAFPHPEHPEVVALLDSMGADMGAIH